MEFLSVREMAIVGSPLFGRYEPVADGVELTDVLGVELTVLLGVADGE